MTTNVDIVNRALQTFGSRTTITDLNEVSNETRQANIALTPTRDQLIRMAPWNCATIYDNLTLITSAPGTPESLLTPTEQWERGQPAPPWLYEYQYPANCARPLFIVAPQGVAQGTPIYPPGVVTGRPGGTWSGPAIPFKVALDFFYSIAAVSVLTGGSDYEVNDIIHLGRTSGTTEVPNGAAASLVVTAVSGGIVTTAVPISITGGSPPVGGSYFTKQTAPILGYPDGSTINDANTQFNVTWNLQGQQRVILTNQADATMALLTYVSDPNVMDPEFQEAWVLILGAKLCKALSGDTEKANALVKEANARIELARQSDANEGLTVIDGTPDWIRARGYASVDAFIPGLDWGPLFPLFS